jgi:hypothetical protein
MQFAFLLGTSVFSQLQEPVGNFMKKDFVPYSERRALEAQLEADRLQQAGAPGSSVVIEGDVATVQELVDLLPL